MADTPVWIDYDKSSKTIRLDEASLREQGIEDMDSMEIIVLSNYDGENLREWRVQDIPPEMVVDVLLASLSNRLTIPLRVARVKLRSKLREIGWL